ncbi:MAG: ArsC family transcriptional regulator [Oscillospiraceae bacterium]|nr:ArsC family transcriptional regulator [Oscillospiraceae bacterium]
MNIQIFGKSKSFDSKKAERWFKERRIKYQYIDLGRYGMSRGELKSVASSAGLDNIIDWSNEDSAVLKYLASAEAKLDKLYEYPELLKTPIVRNGKQATAGYMPDVWKTWE